MPKKCWWQPCEVPTGARTYELSDKHLCPTTYNICIQGNINIQDKCSQAGLSKNACQVILNNSQQCGNTGTPPAPSPSPVDPGPGPPGPAAPPTDAPTGAPTPDDHHPFYDDIPLWEWIVGGVVLLALLMLVFKRQQRSTDDAPRYYHHYYPDRPDQ